ncbi:hypothetical protein ACQR05_03370 [Bradyrhizobium oligotrophicum]
MQLFANDIGLTSVRCRGLFVPHSAIPSVLARSTRPLLFENDDPDYVYTKRGSCTLLAFHKECFVVFAEHQRHGYRAEAIRIVQGFTGGPALASDTFIAVNPCGGEEVEDLRALRISTDRHTHQELSDFFPLAERPLPPVQSALMLIAVGTPTWASTIEYDPAHIHVGTVPVACIYERKSTTVAGLHTVSINSSRNDSLHRQVDGMSGAPIFSVDGQPGSYAVNFRGTILRGGNGHLHYMDNMMISKMFEQLQSPEGSRLPR